MTKRTRGQTVATPDGPEGPESLPPTTGTRISTKIGDGTFTYYANYAEIVCTSQEFAILFARMPAKVPPDKIDEVKAGRLNLTCDVQILIPTTMIDGLIRALVSQKAAYEQRYGPIRTPGGMNIEG
jgi:hypothetical protein